MDCPHVNQKATDFVDSRGWALAIACSDCGEVLAIERP